MKAIYFKYYQNSTTDKRFDLIELTSIHKKLVRSKKSGVNHLYIEPRTNLKNINAKTDLIISFNGVYTSGLYFDSKEFKNLAYGDIKNSNDMFLLNYSIPSVEIIVIKDGKNESKKYFEMYYKGELNELIEELKEQSREFSYLSSIILQDLS